MGTYLRSIGDDCGIAPEASNLSNSASGIPKRLRTVVVSAPKAGGSTSINSHSDIVTGFPGHVVLPH